MTENLELKVFQMIQKAVVENIEDEEMIFQSSKEQSMFIHARVGSLYQRYVCLKDEMNKYGLQIYIVETCGSLEDSVK